MAFSWSVTFQRKIKTSEAWAEKRNLPFPVQLGVCEPVGNKNERQARFLFEFNQDCTRYYILSLFSSPGNSYFPASHPDL